jgi:hypothetical protein
MSQSETEHDRKVREFWAKKSSIYDIGSIDFKDDHDHDKLPFKPAVLSTKSNQPIKRSIYEISSLDFTT